MGKEAKFWIIGLLALAIVSTGAWAVCGDGTVEMPAEQCDDGNTDDGDGCSSTCQLECNGTPLVDEMGANDLPGQKDLTQQCVDMDAFPNDDCFTASWSWDDTGFPGMNTADACALFDTDGDGNINYALCVTVGGNPSVLKDVRLYSCGDGSPDRCTQPVVEQLSFDSICFVSIVSTDPFPAGDDFPDDTEAICKIFLTDIPNQGIDPTLKNVCSFASEQPNSNPSECIVDPTTGACCSPSLGCVEGIEEATCLEEVGATFQGVGTDCVNDPCPTGCTGTCGDQICCPDVGENSCTCPADCGSGTCGDMICCADEGEDTCTCPTDCGSIGCGDGICCVDAEEDTCNCPTDCGTGTCDDGICCAGENEDACTCPEDCENEPPTITCPDSLTTTAGDDQCGAVVDFEDPVATDDCPGEIQVVCDPPSGSVFPSGTTTVTCTATDASGQSSECSFDVTVQPSRVSSSQKGSLLIFSKVELKWNADGTQLLQDTFLDVSNDFPAAVMVQAYFINGDTELAALGDNEVGGPRDFEPGWNTADCRFSLTANQPHYWSAANGSGKCQPFTVLDVDGPGRPDPETNGATRILRGYVVMWAVRFNADKNLWEEIRWNHLKGGAVLVNYENSSAWEYNAWAFRATPCSGGQGAPLIDCAGFDVNGVCRAGEVIPGNLDLDGFQYDIAFESLLLDFYGSGTLALSGGDQIVMTDTDLTVHAVSADLRQDGCGPVLTKVEAEVWNENESKFSGTRRCICCWDQTMLSDWSHNQSIPNHFLRSALGTDKGKARLDGVASTECDYESLCGPTAKMKRWYNCTDTVDPGVAALGNGFFDASEDAAILGLATKFLAFSPSGKLETAGMNLVGVGRKPATIIHDVTPITDGQELNVGKDLRSSPRRPTR
jgi:hypothetical protein